jgi:hypothetical protein
MTRDARMSRSTIPSLRTYSRLLVMDGTVNYRASKSFYQHKQRQPMALENPWQLIQHLQEKSNRSYLTRRPQILDDMNIIG